MRWVALILVVWAGEEATAQTDCDDSYPDVCIPPPPPDLDCPEVEYTNFRVLSPDPHGFDRDRDGIGCED
jgi:micrococcal nuclease